MRLHARACRFVGITSLLACGLVALAWHPVYAQQFNSDNYLSKPAGVATIIVTAGEQGDMVMTTFSLIPRWEFTYAVYVINSDKDRSTDNGYSTSLYFKYMIHENAAKTGGLAFKGGTGLDPGYLGSVGLEDAFQTWWVNAPVTFPFFGNKVSWDLMPGASYTNNRGTSTGCRLGVHLFHAGGLVSQGPQARHRGRGLRWRRGGGDPGRVQGRAALGAESVRDLCVHLRPGIREQPGRGTPDRLDVVHAAVLLHHRLQQQVVR